MSFPSWKLVCVGDELLLCVVSSLPWGRILEMEFGHGMCAVQGGWVSFMADWEMGVLVQGRGRFATIGRPHGWRMGIVSPDP